MPPTLLGEIVWCQLFSEPGAGSDLAVAADEGRAGRGRLVAHRPEGLDLAGAQRADWGDLPRRAPTRRRAASTTGITYFLVDMKRPGVDVRPLREMTGEALFNEVFLDDVFVPDDCVVGEVDGGWQARPHHAGQRAGRDEQRVGRSPSASSSCSRRWTRARRPTDDAALVAVGELVCRAQADAMLGVRATLRQLSGTDPGAASSVRKLVGMHLRQDASRAALSAARAAARHAGGRSGDRRAATPPRHPRTDDRRRHQRGPAQRHRRAHPRATEGLTAWSMT